MCKRYLETRKTADIGSMEMNGFVKPCSIELTNCLLRDPWIKFLVEWIFTHGHAHGIRYSKKPAIFCPCLLLYVHKPALIVISQGLNIWKYGYMDRIVQFSNMFSNLIRMKSLFEFMIVAIYLCRQVGIFCVFGGAVSYISLMYAHFI